MDEKTFHAYAAIVAQVYGIQLPSEKQALLEARLARLQNEHNGEGPFRDAESFLRWVREDRTGEAVRLLGEAITTHHTYFLREKDHFELFRDRTLPWLEQVAAPDRDLRVWCAASSTGEEAYALAMLLADYFSLKGEWEKTLLATDVSREVLEQAARGRYAKEAVAALPPSWQQAYFHRLSDDVQEVVPQLRRAVLFRPFNLMTEVFPFKRPFHVIFCRNVMIYFDRERRAKLVRKFYDSLVPGGWLFVGHAETVAPDMAPFRYAQPSVYRKPEQENEPRLARGTVVWQRPAAQPSPASVPQVSALPKEVAPSAGDKVKAPALPLESQAAPGRLRLIVIGASTGGTEALAEVFQGLMPPLPPIVVVQHIPPHFSRLFAERLNAESRLEVCEAEEGMQLEPNHAYIAPGDKHVRVQKLGGMLLLSCASGAPVNGHCPSVDVLFRSAVVLRERALGLILTGMGDDGAAGLLAMREAGAHTLGQDEGTSVVYGMPRAAWLAGAVERQLPLSVMASALTAYARQE